MFITLIFFLVSSNVFFSPIFCYVVENFEGFNRVENDHDIVYMPPFFENQEAFVGDQKAEEIPLEFTAFGRPISLVLRKNNLVSPKFKTHIVDGTTTTQLPYYKNNCNFLHEDSFMVAAINACQGKIITGFIFFENVTLEIRPLHFYEAPLLEEAIEDTQDPIPHIIKRASLARDYFRDDAVYVENFPFFKKKNFKRNDQTRSTRNSGLILEVALFFDAAAYEIFAPFFSHNDVYLIDMLLAYVNAVQALYKHPSIGSTLDIVVVRIDIMKAQPKDLPHHNGERSSLLDSFCEYQDAINPKEDDNDDHWDMALYVSGLDFFAYENGRKSGVTMGLATVGGVCYSRYACIIAEFGTTNIFGKPYPSAGFTSVYILAHEIGHNLGMHHDGTRNSCSKEGFIMSPSRGVQGETKWSTCSAEVMYNLGWANCLKDKGTQPKQLDHTKFKDIPGRTYTAKKQCEILLRDKDAYVVPEDDPSNICYSLRCKTPHRSGYYFAGPALDGTECAKDMQCHGGDCVKQVNKPNKVIVGGWSPWKIGECKSECLVKSNGYQVKNRICNNPIPVNTDEGCQGSTYEHMLCKDIDICLSKRRTAVEYASEKCKTFAEKIPELDPKGQGLQSPHEEDRLWMGCAIFCRKQDGTYYTPRLELNDLGIDSYFPDGTWCHHDKGVNYFCNHHHCLPENFKFSKNWFVDMWDDDFNFPQNALPHSFIPYDLKPYLSLGRNGKPLQMKPNFQINFPREEEWETDDYLLLPNDDLNMI